MTNDPTVTTSSYNGSSRDERVFFFSICNGRTSANKNWRPKNTQKKDVYLQEERETPFQSVRPKAFQKKVAMAMTVARRSSFLFIGRGSREENGKSPSGWYDSDGPDTVKQAKKCNNTATEVIVSF